MVLNTYVDIPAPILYVPEYEPLEWAKKHCKSYLATDAVQDRQGNYYYRFFFSDEKDVAWFSLRWA